MDAINAIPSLVAWCFLPGGAATGDQAQQVGGLTAQKTASAGQWLIVLNQPASLMDGTILIMQGPGVPSDTDSGVVASIGDNGVGVAICTIKAVDGGGSDDNQPLSLMFWRLPAIR